MIVVAVTVPVNVGFAVRATVPVAAGSVSVFVPAADGGEIVICPETEPLSVRALVKLSVVIVAVPLTVNNVLGELVPMPMLPLESMRMRSEPLVLNCIGSAF